MQTTDNSAPVGSEGGFTRLRLESAVVWIFGALEYGSLLVGGIARLALGPNRWPSTVIELAIAFPLGVVGGALIAGLLGMVVSAAVESETSALEGGLDWATDPIPAGIAFLGPALGIGGAIAESLWRSSTSSSARYLFLGLLIAIPVVSLVSSLASLGHRDRELEDSEPDGSAPISRVRSFRESKVLRSDSS